MRIDEYVELSREEQAGGCPSSTRPTSTQRLIKVECSASIVALVKDRRRYWQMLQYLSGVHEAKLDRAAPRATSPTSSRYEQAMRDRESSIDVIAEAMSSLATSSRAPVGRARRRLPARGHRVPPAPLAAPHPADRARRRRRQCTAGRPVHLAEVDLPKCNDCGTCYQELPPLFEPHSMVVDGAVQKVARMMPGALETVEMTPEIAQADRPGEEDLRRGDHPVSADVVGRPAGRSCSAAAWRPIRRPSARRSSRTA